MGLLDQIVTNRQESQRRFLLGRAVEGCFDGLLSGTGFDSYGVRVIADEGMPGQSIASLLVVPNDPDAEKVLANYATAHGLPTVKHLMGKSQQVRALNLNLDHIGMSFEAVLQSLTRDANKPDPLELDLPSIAELERKIIRAARDGQL